MTQGVLIIFIALNVFFLLKNILTVVFSLENYKLHKERLKQLQFEDKQSDDEEINDLIDKITQPIIKNAFPRLKLVNLEQIERDLKLVGWEKKASPKQYLALIYAGRALGLGLFLVLLPFSKFMAFLWGAVLFFAASIFLSNKAKNIRNKTLTQFPDFIRVTQGYLSAGFTLPRAIEETIPHVEEPWLNILENFVITNQISGTDIALDKIVTDADIFEAREFVSLVKLTLEQGGKAKDGFEQQANRIQEMLHDAMLNKVERRAIYGIIIQGPLLLCSLVVFGLPTFGGMMSLGL